MLSVMSFEVGTSYSAQSIPYTCMEGNALCCCKDSANLRTCTHHSHTCTAKLLGFISFTLNGTVVEFVVRLPLPPRRVV